MTLRSLGDSEGKMKRGAESRRPRRVGWCPWLLQSRPARSGPELRTVLLTGPPAPQETWVRVLQTKEQGKKLGRAPFCSAQHPDGEAVGASRTFLLKFSLISEVHKHQVKLFSTPAIFCKG